MKTLSIEKWIEKHYGISLTKEAKNINTYSFNDVINMTCGYHSYLLEKQVEYIEEKLLLNKNNNRVFFASNEFLKQLSNEN